MSQTIDIPAGSYFEAATLASRFNPKAVREEASEKLGVTMMLDKALDFMSDIAGKIATGWSMMCRAPKPYSGYGIETFFEKSNVYKIAEKPMPGDGAGVVQLQVAADTENKLDHIRQAFKLASNEHAARLAIDVFSRMQNVYNDNTEFHLINNRNRSMRQDLAKYRMTCPPGNPSGGWS